MFGKKKENQDIDPGGQQSQKYAEDFLEDQLGDDDAFLNAISELTEKGDEKFSVPDPNVELNRDLAQLAMGYGEYEDILPSVTNFDHPVQASTVAVDLTELEMMRAMGLPQNIYQIIKGGHGMNTGPKGVHSWVSFLKAELGKRDAQER